MTSHTAPARGDLTGCCGIPVSEVDELVPDEVTPSCGVPVVEPDLRAA